MSGFEEVSERMVLGQVYFCSRVQEFVKVTLKRTPLWKQAA